MAAQGERTFLVNGYDPEVLGDMISAKLSKKIRVTPFAKIDTTLVGRAGSSVTIPVWDYTGAAEAVAEGEEIPIHKLTSTSRNYSVKKIGDGKTLSDELLMSSVGDPYGETTSQLAKSIADYIDDDAMGELQKASKIYEASTKISYNNIVDSIDLFEEEINSDKIMFIHPLQQGTLRKDANFISADKYGAGTNVIMKGEIGMIANTRIVASKRVAQNVAGYKKSASGVASAKEVVADSTQSPSATQIKIGTITKTYPASYEPQVGDYVLEIAANTFYINPIVKLNDDMETTEDTPALTIFLKRDTNVEVDRKSRTRETEITADKNYVAALTNDSRVTLMFSKIS